MLKKIWHFFFPQKVDVQNVQFDIDRSKFSVGSILLALVLGGFLFFQTESALFEVDQFLDEPICPVFCSEINLQNSGWNDYWFEDANPTEYVIYKSEHQEVRIFDIYPELRLVYAQVRVSYLQIDRKKDQISHLQDSIQDLENQNESERVNYETGLLEDIANSEERAFDSGTRREVITSARSQILNLSNHISQANSELVELENNFQTDLKSFKTVHDLAFKKYIATQHGYDLKLVLIRFLLTLPLLLIGVWWYKRAQEKQSKYTVLPLILLVIGAITFLQVLLMYASSWIPMEFFEEFFGWLMKLAFGEVIVHYLIVFFGVVVVGGLIVSIQKKLFSGKRQSLRRLNHGECPFCGFPMRHSDKFCSGCGEELKITCAKCGKPTLKMLAHCQNCGQNPKKIVK